MSKRLLWLAQSSSLELTLTVMHGSPMVDLTARTKAERSIGSVRAAAICLVGRKRVAVARTKLSYSGLSGWGRNQGCHFKFAAPILLATRPAPTCALRQQARRPT